MANEQKLSVENQEKLHKLEQELSSARDTF